MPLKKLLRSLLGLGRRAPVSRHAGESQALSLESSMHRARQMRRMTAIRHAEFASLRQARAQLLEDPWEPLDKSWLATTRPLPRAGRLQLLRNIERLEGQLADPSQPGQAREESTHSAIWLARSPTRRAATRPTQWLDEAVLALSAEGAREAERILWRVVLSDPAARETEEAWVCLLDLLRVQQDEPVFLQAALDYAQYRGRSSPVDFCRLPGHGLRHTQALQWECPAVLDVETARHLLDALSAPGPVALDWSALRKLAAGCAPVLAQVLHALASRSAHINMREVGKLEGVVSAVLYAQAEASEWQPLFAFLRYMNRSVHFEEAAVCYSLRFHCSPPDWQPPVASGGALAQRRYPRHARGSIWQGVVRELGIATLRRSYSVMGKPMTFAQVDLAPVIRLDTRSLAAVCQWVSERKKQGLQTYLRNPHRLLAWSFRLLDVPRHAHVIPEIRRLEISRSHSAAPEVSCQ